MLRKGVTPKQSARKTAGLAVFWRKAKGPKGPTITNNQWAIRELLNAVAA
jgi:hypothetical protein